MKCTECKYCVMQDYGYSNYTVEGTMVSCLLDKNPEFPEDRWYNEHITLGYAENCNSFSDGDAVLIDVEMDDGCISEYSDDPEIKELLIKWDDK